MKAIRVAVVFVIALVACSCRTSKRVASEVSTSETVVVADTAAAVSATTSEVRDTAATTETEQWWSVEYYPPTDSTPVQAVKRVTWRGRNVQSVQATTQTAAAVTSETSATKVETKTAMESKHKESVKQVSKTASAWWWLLLLLVIPVAYLIYRYVRRKFKI